MVSDPSFCLFRCGSQPLAVAVDEVAEIVETEAIVRISACPPRITGLCPYHRQVVPVVTFDPDLGRAEGQPHPAGHGRKAEPQAVLILRTAWGPWGIKINLDGTAITSARPAWHEPRGGGEGFVSIGSIRQGETDHLLLDPGSTWQAIRELILNWYARIGEAPFSSATLPAGSGWPEPSPGSVGRRESA
jgi:hypothetical protein